MTKKLSSRSLSKPSVSRRDFLTYASLSGLAISGTRPLFAGVGEILLNDESPISPGYFAPQYYDFKEEEALLDVLESGSPFRYYGPGNPEKVKSFEEAYSEYMGVPYALGVTSGTAALDCAVTALEVGPGDEVIVPAYTWWSDYTCVIQAGALPVFADIDESLCLDPKDFARKITPRTKAVIAVHLLGGPCDMDPILETAKKHGVAVLEDAAQCVGGSYKGKKLGSIGDVGIYSFQLHKMISSGEGGALVTSNPKVFERAVRFHDMGGLRTVFEERLGTGQVARFAGENFRMSEFTGAVLGAQLPKLDTMIRSLRENADSVREGIKNLPGIKMRKRPDPAGDNGYAIYIELGSKQARDRCIDALEDRGIPAGTLSGSVLLPLQDSVIQKQTRHPNWPSFNSPEGRAIEYGPDSCRQTLDIFDRFVQIRIGPKYTQPMIDRIIDGVRRVYPSVT
ncbi:MAG: DegT/DnrJ/EryC1/StrS family aminotransferase [Acidobacteriota bacterium]|nr:MAG: DegT/DnrJ/EryC1/StrS family aminotransferase [Acidobacteriota bacterium]